MTTEHVDIVINESGGRTVRRTLEDIANSAQQAAQGIGKLSSSTDGFVSSLKRQADTLGFTRTQVLAYDAAQLKLTASQKASVDASIKQIAAFDKTQDAARKNVDVLGSLKGQLIGVAAAYLSFTGVIAGGRSVLDAAIANERLMNTLTVGVGSVQAATREYAFLRQETDRLGLQFVTTADQYAKLTAASKGTQLEGQATRDIFLAIAQASTVLGLSSDQAGGALLAVQQIISKSKVSAEELRGQLGERLAGAFNTAARAMNLTTAELDKMLETGTLVADQFLPKFAAELNKTFAGQSQEAASGLNAKVNRLDNSFNELKLTVGRVGLIDVFSGGIDFVTKFISVIERAVESMGRLVAKAKQLPFIGGGIDLLSSAPKALFGGGLIDFLDRKFTKPAPIDTTLIAPQLIADTVGSGVIKPTTKPGLPKEVLDQLKKEAQERDRLSKQLESQKKRELESSLKAVESLKLETKEIGLNAIQKKMLMAATEASKAPTEKLRKEIMDSAAAYGQLALKQEQSLAFEKDLQRIKSIENEVATPQEKFESAKIELDNLRKAGLSQETYNRALNKTEDELLRVKNTGRDVFGSMSQYAIQAARNIQTSLANFLFDPFADGLEGMVNGVVNAVRRMIAEFASMKIAQSIGLSELFGLGSGIGGTGNKAFSLLDAGSSLINIFSGGSRGLGSFIGRGASALGFGSFGAGASGAASAGVFGAGGLPFLGGSGTALGGVGTGAAAAAGEFGALATVGSGLAAVAAPLAALAAGFIGGKLLAGNKSIAGIDGTTASLIGTALGGPVGAVVAGSILSLFGHGPLKFRQEVGIGTASASGFDGRITDVFRAKGGLFVGNKHKEFSSPNEAALTELFDTTIKGFANSAKGFAQNLGTSTDVVTGFSKEIRLESEKGKRITQEAIGNFLAGIGDEIFGGVVAQLGAIGKRGESNIETLQRLSTEFDLLNTAALATGRSLKQAREDVLSLPIAFRTQLVDSLGGVDAAGQKISFFIDNFLSDTERFKPMFESLDLEMQKLGFSASITRKDFTKLVQSIGLVGGISTEQFTGLLEISSKFDEFDRLRTKLSQSTDNLIEKEQSLLDIRNSLSSAYQRERSELENTISRFGEIASQLKGYRESLLLGELSPLTPEQRLNEARDQFNQVRIKAASGDEEALSKLPNVAQEFLKASQLYNASGAAFVSDFNLVQNVLKNSESAALSQVDIAKGQLKALDASVGYLLNIEGNTKTTADLIREINVKALTGPGNGSISTKDIQGFLAANPNLTPQQIANAATKYGVSNDQLLAAGYDVTKLPGGVGISDNQIKEFVKNHSPMEIYNAAIKYGITSQRLSSVTGIPPKDIEKFVKDNNLPSFAKGTDFISRSGLAMVHRAEAIVPSSTTEEIKKLREEIAKLRAEQNAQTGDLIKVTDITNRQNAQVISQALVESEKNRSWNNRSMLRIA